MTTARLLSTLIVCASALQLACSCAPEPSTELEPAPEQEPEPEPTPEGLDFPRDSAALKQLLADIDEEIAKAELRAEDKPNSWLVLDKIAGLYLRRARLSGDYQDYAKAEDALERGFERAAEGSGPLLTRAALNFTLHRLDRVEPDLEIVANRAVVDDPTRAAIEGLRGDLAFQGGDDEAAKAHYDAALELDDTPSNLARLARWRWRHGDFDGAEELYLAALGEMLPDALEPRAWTHLQLGIMDLERGRYEQAFEHYREGAEILGGWWLIEEHIAEIAALLGLEDFAIGLYTQIIAATGKGEFYDAKAALLAEAGQDEAAAALVDRAEADFQAKLQQFPEASYGHALGHYLDYGPAAQALQLAELNHELRPNPSAKIELAQARLAVGDLPGAEAIVDEALASPWVWADIYWVGALVHERVGEAEEAAELREQALALHPSIAEDF